MCNSWSAGWWIYLGAAHSKWHAGVLNTRTALVMMILMTKMVVNSDDSEDTEVEEDGNDG